MNKTQIKKFNDTQVQRDYFLDLLKGICVFFVILHHAVMLPYMFGRSFPTYKELGFPFYVYQAIPIYLIISGYVWTLGYEKKHINKWYEPFKPLELLRKFLRILIPFTLAFCADMIIYASLGLFNWIPQVEESSWWQMFLLGGLPEFGAYYIMICFQLVFIIPLFYALIKKFDWKAVLVIGILASLWELLRWAVNMPDQVYEYAIFSHMLLPAWGIWLCLNIKKRKQNFIATALMFAVGATMIALRFYSPLDFNYYIGPFNDTTFSFLFAMAICETLIRYCHVKHKAWGFIGKTTFSFYLTQKSVFNLVMYDGNMFFYFNDFVNILIWIAMIIPIAIAFYFLAEWLITDNINKGIKKWQFHLNQQNKNKVT